MIPISVLSGDLIQSSKLTERQVNDAISALADAAQDVARWAPELRTGFARSSGDGWQFFLSSEGLALRSSLYLRAALRRLGKPFSTRIALASGSDSLPPDGNPNSATGPVFTTSGRLLQTLTGPHIQMAHATGGTAHAATLLADHISQSWTPAQARAMVLMLPPEPPTHATAAAALGISRQAVDQALSAAGYHALADALTAFEHEGTGP